MSARRPPDRRSRPDSVCPDRATSPVVGVVVLVGVTTVLAAVTLGAVGIDHARPRDPPQVHLRAELSAADGWPDGQRLRLVHEAGDSLAVADLGVVVEFEAAGATARIRELPTRRLSGEHVRGAPLFDRTYAGVDGAFDAAHADGRWESGEVASVRVAQRALDVQPGDRAVVRVYHRPTGAPLARVEVVAS